MQIDAGRAAGAVSTSFPAGGLEDAPVFHGAGDAVSGEFLCAECGYGVSVRAVLPICPMCRGSAWEEPGAVSHVAGPL